MYKRYEPIPSRKPQAPHNKPQNGQCGGGERKEQQRPCRSHRQEQRPHPPQNTECERQPQKETKAESKHGSVAQLLTKFIPQSLYNPETGKILGFLSAEDLLLAAVILLLIDNDGEDGEDNTMLIFALFYILISDHIDLPI